MGLSFNFTQARGISFLETNLRSYKKNMDVVPSFCYLGDMLSAGGGSDLAVTTRCSVAWGKFRKLLPILTTKHVSLKTCGKLFSSCVRSAMLHGSETWAPTVSVLQRL